MGRVHQVLVVVSFAGLFLAAWQPVQAAVGDVLFQVADGANFFDANGDCVGDTDNHVGATALHHWHVGIPLVASDLEVAGGFGCMGAPRTWTVTIPPDSHGAFFGSIAYINDDNEPGAALNDVHIHVYDNTGALLTSTLLTDRPRPVVPGVTGPQSHPIFFVLEPGVYTVVEDVFSGTHTAWATNFQVIQEPGHGG